MDYKNTSLWFDIQDQKSQIRDTLVSDIDVDVAIIGAGFTGLWTAYYLKQHRPELNIAILEAQVAGYGASGRNGGWVAGLIAGFDKYVAPLSMTKRKACCRMLFDNVDEIGAVLASEGIDADYHKGGVIYAAARYPEQVKFQQKLLPHIYASGHSPEDCYWLDAQQLNEKVRMRNGYGGIYKPHCATVNPLSIVKGLAQRLERMGVKIYEKTRVLKINPREVTTEHARVQATTIVPALEGYSSSVRGVEHNIIPVQSLMIATQPLSDALWDEIGLDNREAFSEASRMVTYGQRSADNRMVFGARGGYNFGAKVHGEFSLSDDAFRLRESLMRDLFPMLDNVEVTHGWGGSLGIAREFAPHVHYNEQTGIATVGGYGGQGVAASHLFARTLADLILNRDTSFTQMPWVIKQHSAKNVFKRWEPEPFKWLTSKAITQAYSYEEDLYLTKAGPSLRKNMANQVSNALSLFMR
jgi:glycine/D-amino acid oxidase-like deaminating enzyme